jgi:hypothetical protein
MKITFEYLNSLEWKTFFDNDGDYRFHTKTKEYEIVLYLHKEKKIFDKLYYQVLSVTDLKTNVNVYRISEGEDKIDQLWKNLSKEYIANWEKLDEEIDL